MKYPSAIIFVNNDLTDSIKQTLTTQLYLTSIIDGYVFDELSLDAYYIQNIRLHNQRILVIREFDQFYINRDKADIVCFIKAGLISVEENKVGPPGLTLPVANLHIRQIIDYKNVLRLSSA